jgi:CAAD domains of cyanobacterial aminoacyl-tRNA synthetase
MNPEVQVDDPQDLLPPEIEEVKVDINGGEPTTITAYTPTTSSQSNEQWRQIGEKVSAFLAELPDYLTDFFSEYRRPLITIGLVLGGIVTVKLTLAILDSINDIPLLAPTFELIGVAYSAWFIYRYLLRASNRKELTEDFNLLKEQVLGNRSSNV